MESNNGLTLEQQFKLQQIRQQASELSTKQIKQMLIHAFEQMMVQQNVMTQAIGEQWGIEGAKQQ